MALHLHITSVPAGEAPAWVRAQWVGLALPLAQRKPVPLYFLTSGVVSGPTTWVSRLFAFVTGKLVLRSGFRVEALAAVAGLAARSPEAAAWWRENLPHRLRPGQYFVFEHDSGNVVEVNDLSNRPTHESPDPTA